jgi:uncharacterized protein with von Willebrand factor type A (vWA) domain
MTDENKNGVDDDFEMQDQDELQEIHDFDFQRVSQLMTIAEKVATVAPRCTSLLGIAQAELEHLNEEAKAIARRRAERAKEMEQRRYDAEQARLREEAEVREEETGEDVDPETPAPTPGPGEPSPIRRL